MFNIKRRTFTVFTLESKEAEWLITYLSLTQLSHRMHMPLPFSLRSSTSSDSLWSLFLCFALSHSCISVFHILITSPYPSLSFSFAFSISKHSIFFLIFQYHLQLTGNRKLTSMWTGHQQCRKFILTHGPYQNLWTCTREVNILGKTQRSEIRTADTVRKVLPE